MSQSQVRHQATDRAERTVLAVLPRSIEVSVPTSDAGADLMVNGQPLAIKWAGEGHLGDIRRLLKDSVRPYPDIVVAQRLSPGARAALDEAGIGWVDETGAAEIAIGLMVVSRSGTPAKPERGHLTRWTPAVMAVAEALLCGVAATVTETKSATGLSTGSCTAALRYLTDLGLLRAAAQRGRDSARRIDDPNTFLTSYAAATQTVADPLSLQVGVVWRDPVAELITTGKRWGAAGIDWVATGGVAASVMAPFLSGVSSADVYVDATSIVGLEAVAQAADLRPIDGGRLTLRPFPTVAVRRLCAEIHGLRVAPWPRVYVDLQRTGVRGEEAAEHLVEVIRER